MNPKLLIVHQITGQRLEYVVTLDQIRIGRAVERNDLVLNDERVSRQHALLLRDGPVYMIKDLESANGTFVNGLKVTERLLANNDTIAIGNYTLVFEEQDVASPIEFDSEEIGDTVVLRSPDQITVSTPQPAVTADDASFRSLAEEVHSLRKKAETLSRLYELSRVLSSVFSLNDIFKKAAEMLFRTTSADRFVVLLKDLRTGELVPFTTRSRNVPSGALGSPISISRTVLDRVLRERVSLLSLDAQSDDRLRTSVSIAMQRIRSIMCAPLIGAKGIIGVIYVDCQMRGKTFSADDLDMLNALAAQTSLAVDNATTHDQLLKEALARAAYGRFMPRHVVEQILIDPEALCLGGTNQEVTVLFSDIRGFTGLAESLAPETVVKLLNEYFADMTPIIFSHRGLLDKYLGDGMMAVFGAPYPSEESAANAVAAAIDMQRRMVSLNEELAEAGLPQIAIGIGINTGTVTVGYIGSEQRTDYTVIGDTVNLTARLEKQAGPWQILISQRTLEAVGGRFPVSMFGEVQLRGKSLPVQVYEVVWRSSGQLLTVA